MKIFPHKYFIDDEYTQPFNLLFEFVGNNNAKKHGTDIGTFCFKKYMKKSLIITGIVALGSAAFFYFMRRNRKSIQSNHAPFVKSHHLTNVFAKAKVHAH